MTHLSPLFARDVAFGVLKSELQRVRLELAGFERTNNGSLGTPLLEGPIKVTIMHG
jgi:hypothetical protein